MNYPEMTTEQSNQIADLFLQKCAKVLVQKNQHYAQKDDKLWNFRTQALYEGRTPSQVNLSHMLKQMTTMVKATNRPMPLTFGTATEEGILQKPVDLINYAILWVCNLITEEAVRTGATVQDIVDRIVKEESK